MKKIFINKNDDPALVVENILKETERDLVLVIPKFSKVSDSVSNFHLIKREAEADQKNLLVESVDDDALALAQAAKIPGLNPFLSARKKSMSDIIPPAPEEETSLEATSVKFAKSSKSHKSEGDIEGSDSLNEVEVDFAYPTSRSSKFKFRLPRRSKSLAFIVGFIVLIPVAFSVASSFVPGVTVSLNVKNYDWEWQSPVIASVAGSGDLPAEIFTETKNITIKASASGQKEVARKAGGTINIYNAYSSRPQPLVATTRLLTPDGKLFRLVEQVTVPGAKIEKGEVIPSSITAKVISDQPGEEYNIGPVGRFSIPGFQGSSKYQSFYADSSESMSGGFIGTISFATDEDITKAKDNLTKTLEDNLTALSLASLPADFISDSFAKDFSITKIEINSEADSNGNFSAFGEAELKIIAFPKTNLLNLIKSSASAEFGFPVSIQESNLELNEVEADFTNQTLSFTPSFSGVLIRDLNSSSLSEKIANLSSVELKDFVVSLAGVDGAKISFWPFWVDSTPSNPSRIKIKLNY